MLYKLEKKGNLFYFVTENIVKYVAINERYINFLYGFIFRVLFYFRRRLINVEFCNL